MTETNLDALVTSPPTLGLPSETGTIRGIRIEVVAGPDAGLLHIAAGDRVVVGTHRTADVVLTDRTVSRFHVELAIDRDGASLRDLGSRNGTLLDGVWIEKCRLRGPTIVVVGSTELRIDLEGDLLTPTLAPQERFGDLVGASPVMRAVFARLEHAALHDTHVLIEGERGTGKDLAAAHLHEQGARRDQPFDIVDCAGPPLDVEDALFGRRDDPGALVRCDSGTLVLDEIGALSRTTQRTLARVLESGALRLARGDTQSVNVRIIALSRRSLRPDVNADRFAPDLYELVARARIRLPPLREHPEDVPLLVQWALDRVHGSSSRGAAHLLAADTLEALRCAPWPGNVRELRAYVEQTVAADGVSLDDNSEPPLVDATVTLRDARERWVRYFEREYLTELLARSQGNVAAAAIIAGVDRVHLHRMITRCGLRDLLRSNREGH
ncbi:MAG TPA: sigma 54-interacting transcriptional regulator [Kofleriaceae bacterium]|nr:sigma 54-interacting transcriptional regulator [Kofleriaceae bacterium]